MQGVWLQTAIDLSLPETTPAQQAIAWVVLLAGGATVLYAIYKTHYDGLPERLQRAKADLRGARADTTLATRYLTRSEAQDSDHVRQAATAVLDEDLASDADEQASLRGAAGSVRHHLAETWAPYLVGVSQTVRRLVAYAAVLSIFGFLAVSTDLLLGALETDTPGLQPHKWPVLAATEPAAALARVSGAVGQLPGVGLLWALGVLLVLSVGGWLYAHWYVIAVLLVAGAVAIHSLEQRFDSAADTAWLRQLPRPIQVARVSIAGIVVVWGVTAVVIGMGRLAGPNDRAVAWGGYALAGATLAVVGVAVVAVVRHRNRLARIPDRWRTASTKQRQYLLVRALTLGFAAVVSPLVPIYAGVALTKTPDLLAAYVAAERMIQAVGAAVAMTVAAVLAWQAQAAWGDVRRAIRITAARQSVRSVVAARGIPYAVVIVSYTVFAGLSKSILVGIVAAVAIGAIARELVGILTRVRYHVSLYDRGDSPAGRVVIEGAPLETRDGDPQYYLRVNGATELLHPDCERVITDATTVVTGLADDGSADPTLSEWHARYAFEVGVTDADETIQKLTESVRERLFVALRSQNAQIPTDYLDEQLEDYPDVIVEDRLDHEEYTRGTITRGDQYIRLEFDPYGHASR